MATRPGSLAAAWQHRVPWPLRSRGDGYWRDGAVRLEDVTETRVQARVRGSSLYRVEIQNQADPARATARCTCPFWADHQVCKHVWAVVRAVDDMLESIDATVVRHQQALPQEPSRRRSHAGEDGGEVEPAPAEESPRFSTHRLGERAHEVVADDSDDEFGEVPPTRPRSRHDGHWRTRLEAVLPPVEAGTAPARPSAKARREGAFRVEYHISPLGSFAPPDAVFVLERVVRKLRADGSPGAVRRSKLSGEQEARLSEPDRMLHALVDDGFEWFGNDNGLVVTMDMARIVLPLLRHVHERVFWAEGTTDAPPQYPVQIDVDEPFRPVLTCEPPPGQPAARGHTVSGAFVRSDERMPLAPVDDARPVVYGRLGTRLVRLEVGSGTALVNELARNGPLRVSARELPQLVARLAAARGVGPMLGDLMLHLPVGVPTAVVRVLLPKDLGAPLPATLAFDYGSAHVDAADDCVVAPGEPPVRRDRQAESQWAAKVAAAGVTLDAEGGTEIVRAAFDATVVRLVAAGVVVLAEGRRLRPFVGGSASVATGVDWFDVRAELRFDGGAVGLPELLQGERSEYGFVQLGDGSVGLLPAQWQRRLDAFLALGGDVADGAVRVGSAQGLLLDAMLAAIGDDDVRVDRKFAALRARLAAFTHVAPQDAPAGFVGALRPYQREGLGWLSFLREFGLGGCLADDMGLGKTVQVLAHLLACRSTRRRGKPRRPSILVAPRSVLSNWLAEAGRFVPELAVLDFSGPRRWQEQAEKLCDCDLVLTTYALLRTDAPKFVERELRFSYAVLDEAQMAKNAHSQVAKAARLLRADHRLVLTGTPVENHLGELWALFEFLNPGMLGRLPAFRGLFGAGVDAETLGAHRELLQRALRPVLLRRTKGQVLTDLPSKVETTLWCELEPGQRRRYEELASHYRRLLLQGAEGGGRRGGAIANDHRFLVLEALLRLRQAACHEGLLAEHRRSAESAKFDVLLPRLEQLAAEGHQALVFSQFTSLLDLIEPELASRGIAFERLDGSTPAAARGERVQRFQQESSRTVFLISLKAGGFGLNLTAAGYVFVLDPWWNPAAEMQAIDRAHRIGQQRTVHAYRLVCRGTVEERVLELQAQKRALCEAILGNERSLLQDLTREDLAVLLG